MDFEPDSEIEYNLSSSIPTSLTAFTGESDTPVNKLRSNFQSSLEALPGLLDATMFDLGIVLENDLSVKDTDEEHDEHLPELIMNSKAPSAKKVTKLLKKSEYRKPLRPGIFCKKHQSPLKCHILGKQKDEPLVMPLLKLSGKDLDRKIVLQMRKQGIQDYNMELLKRNETDFMREH